MKSQAHRPPDAAPTEGKTRRTWPRPASPLCASSPEPRPVLTPPAELHLLSEWRDEDRGRRAVWAASGAVLFHIVMYFGAVYVAEYIPPPRPQTSEAVDLRKSVPLVTPPDLLTKLTQREANKSKVAKELSVENLTARPERKPPPRIATQPPAPPAGRPTPAAPPALEPSQIQIAQAPPPVSGTIPNLQDPPVPKPPQPQTEDKPKLTFETPGIQTTRPMGLGRIETPKTGVQEAMRNAMRPGPTGLSVGDTNTEQELGSGIGQMQNQTGATGRQASSLELLSDPMGVDFKPYLIRVLAAVRKNWFAVIPESARFGKRGRVILQFAISRTGSVPKLVIVMPSGTEALDRAAVAGVSASNPFPPLPTEFHGDVIRLQLAFSYNVPSR